MRTEQPRKCFIPGNEFFSEHFYDVSVYCEIDDFFFFLPF